MTDPVSGQPDEQGGAVGAGQVGFPDVQGFCPACGSTSLFLGAGGYVTCPWMECSNPSAPSERLGVTFPEAAS